MKLVNLFTVVFTSIFVGSSSIPISQVTPTLLQKLVSSLGARSHGIRSTPESDSSDDATSPSVLMSKLMYSLSNDYDLILKQESNQRRHHVRRGAPYPRNHGRRKHGTPRKPLYKTPVCIRDHKGRCIQRGICGFSTPIDVISHNPRFGCKSITRAGEARRW
uniref:Uncharacterized protein LOC100185743 n=1 Tax=Phallusia mammillata TaxID=59560 RepID=A0A6F9DJ16_9ASCI|nr:uncharacterized protein LOC100185743 [Phallusia mammillata]